MPGILVNDIQKTSYHACTVAVPGTRCMVYHSCTHMFGIAKVLARKYVSSSAYLVPGIYQVSIEQYSCIDIALLHLHCCTRKSRRSLEYSTRRTDDDLSIYLYLVYTWYILYTRYVYII